MFSARFARAAGILLLIALGAPKLARAQEANEAYLREFPTAARVLADMQGSDAAETALRQWAAFHQLSDMVGAVGGPRAHEGRDMAAIRLFNDYANAMGHIPEPKFDPAETQRLGVNSPRAKWLEQRTEYETSIPFRDQLLARWFSPEFRTYYLSVAVPQEAQWQRAYDAQRAQSEQREQDAQRAQAARARVEAARQKAMADKARARAALELQWRMWLWVAFLAPVVMGFLVLTGRSEVDDAEPTVMHLGNTRYELLSLTGVVLGRHRALETRSYVSGGGSTGQPVSTTHATIDHLDFFVRPEKGPEQEISLRNSSFQVRDGHIVSLVIARAEGAKKTPYVMLRNHSTDMNVIYNTTLDRLLFPRGAFFRMATVLLSLLTVRALFLPLIPYLIVAKIVRKIQRGHVILQITARYVPMLDGKAAKFNLAPSPTPV